MRTDVKVGVICAFLIVLCVVIYFVARSPRPAPVRPETPAVAHPTSNSDLRVASPATPSNPVVTPDPILPDRTVASSGSTGNPIGGGLISPPGASPIVPTTPAAPIGSATPGVSPLTPVIPGMTGPTPIIGTSPVVPIIPTPIIPTPAPGPTLTIGSSTPILPIGPAAGGTTYKIQKGDMLGAIARKHNVSLKALQDANPGVDPTRLKIDAVIKIPAATVAVRPTTPTTPGIGGTTPVRTSTPAAVTIRPGTTYTIRKGDTLSTISKAAYGNTSGGTKIFRANRDALNDPDVMPAGVAIKIP